MNLAVLFISILVGSECVIQHNLIWRPSARRKALEKGKMREFLHERNLRRIRLSEVSNPVMDYYDYEYVQYITIGNPEQQLIVVPDTGSANLWVPASDCGLSCTGSTKFYSSQSSTFQNYSGNFQISYGSGGASGYLGMDSVKLGAKAEQQLEIPNTVFGLATEMSMDFFTDPASGIMGLAFQSLAADKIVPPLINAYNQKVMDPLFTVYFEPGGKSNGNPGGSITYGGVDTVNCDSSVTYVKLSRAAYYQITVSAFYMGSGKYTKSAEAISDTGTSLIVGTNAIINPLVKGIGATYDLESGLYIVDCNKQPKLTLTIDGNNYVIEPVNLVGQDRNTCYLNMDTMSGSGFSISVILGDPFIRQYCQVYDFGNERIGFSNPKKLCSEYQCEGGKATAEVLNLLLVMVISLIMF